MQSQNAPSRPCRVGALRLAAICAVEFVIVAAGRAGAYTLVDLVIFSIWVAPFACLPIAYWAGIQRKPSTAVLAWFIAGLGNCAGDLFTSPSTWPRAGAPGSEFEWVFAVTLSISMAISMFFAAGGYLLSRYVYHQAGTSDH